MEEIKDLYNMKQHVGNWGIAKPKRNYSEMCTA
jgi:hypothetical protein